MSNVVSKFEYSRNFWEYNTQFKATEPFKSLYVSDKSKGKERSSTSMWAIALCYDFDSQYFGMEEGQRKEMIGQDVMEDKDFFDKDNIKVLSEAYQTLTDTPARRQLRVWNKKLDEKNVFLKDIKYDKSNWKMIDEMLKANKELYDNYFKIEKQIMNESAADMVEGGAEESLIEKGILNVDKSK